MSKYCKTIRSEYPYCALRVPRVTVVVLCGCANTTLTAAYFMHRLKTRCH